MIEWTYTRAKKAKLLADVVVATDDDRIFETVVAFGGQALMTSAQHATGTDRLIETQSKFLGYSILVNIQGDEPGIEPELIDGVAATKQAHPEWEVVTAAVPFLPGENPRDPNRVKVIFDRTGKALYFSRALIPFPFQSEAGLFRHLGIYAYESEFLPKIANLPSSDWEKAESLEQLRVLQNGYSIGIYQAEKSCLAVDTPQDLEAVLADFRARSWI